MNRAEMDEMGPLDDVEPTELEAAEEAKQESYGALIDVLVANGLMTQDKDFNHALSIGFTRELWGADCPDQFTQAAIIGIFFERLVQLNTGDAMQVIAAYLKHADDANYVTSLEEDAEEAEEADNDDLSKL